MSLNIPNHMVEAYARGVEHLAQQRGSRLRNFVSVDAGVVGERKYYDQMGVATATAPTSRHADTPIANLAHPRRAVDLVDREWGEIVDDFDKLKTLNDPTNDYVQAAGMALGRAIDTEIIAAATRTAVIQSAGANSTEAFDTTNQQVSADIGGANTNMNIEKLRNARHILRANEAIVDGEPIVAVMTSAQVDALLQESVIQSIDQNTVRALVGGEVTSFMGFTFVQTELVPMFDADDRGCLVFPMSGIKLAIAKDTTHRVGEDPGKRFSTRVYSCVSIGATRMQSEKVVRVLCDDDAAP